MFNILKRIIGESWTNFWRQGGITFATCIILVLAISFIGSLVLIKSFTDYAVKTLEAKVDISVYFAKDSLESDILSIKDQILHLPEVSNVEYVSRDEALERFTQSHQNDSELIASLEEIGDNPLLAALNIKAQQFSQYEKVSEYLTDLQTQAPELIEKVDYFQRRPIIERIGSLASGVKTAGIAISVIFSFIAILITFNTIRLAIFNHREEISIQRLVGASNWFIRGPFLVQGILSGIISALISFVLLGFFSWILGPRIASVFSDLNITQIFFSDIWILLLVQIFAGMILGTVSSLFAIRKYLVI